MRKDVMKCIRFSKEEAKGLQEKARNSRRGHWFTSGMGAVNRALTKERLINSGFYDLTIAYQSMHVNY